MPEAERATVQVPPPEPLEPGVGKHARYERNSPSQASRPNFWEFGKPNPTADYITDIWGNYKWPKQKKAERGDIIWDGCFYYYCVGKGLCALIHEDYDAIIFKIPPAMMYKHCGSSKADKINTVAIMENTRETMRQEMDKVWSNFDIANDAAITPLGASMIAKTISRQVDKAIGKAIEKIRKA